MVIIILHYKFKTTIDMIYTAYLFKIILQTCSCCCCRIVSLCCIVFCCLCASYAQDARFDWVKQVGGANGNAGLGGSYRDKSIAADSRGNIYSIGGFSGIIDADPGASAISFNSVNGSVFISKYDSRGNLIWAKQFGNSQTSASSAAYSTLSDQLYITGYFKGSANFGSSSAPVVLHAADSGSLYVMKIDAGGNTIWAKRTEGQGNISPRSIAVDKSGNPHITGYFTHTIDFNPGAAANNLTDGGCFVLKLDTSGNFVWARNWANSDNNVVGAVGYGIVVDDNGNTLTTGHFSHTVDFNPGTGVYPLIAFGGLDVFISKLDVNGNFLWAKQLGGATQDEGFSIDVDAMGNVYTTGIFSNKADFDPGADTYNLVSGAPVSGSVVPFISKLDTSGNFVWAKQLYSTGSRWGNFSWSLKYKANNIYIAGTFYGTLDADPGPDTFLLTTSNASTLNSFIVKLTDEGLFQWAKQSSNHINAYSLCVDDNNNIYTAGIFNERGTDFNFGPDSFLLDPLGNYDGFLLKMYECLTTEIATTTCDSFTFNDITYTLSGTYYQTIDLGEEGGCTSYKIVVEITRPEAAIIRQGNILNTDTTYAAYQWLLHNENIPGATLPTFHITENGIYRVVVTDKNGCSDTSGAIVVSDIEDTQIGRVTGEGREIKIYPNPAGEELYVLWEQDAFTLTLSGTDGSCIGQYTNTHTLSLNQLKPGLYFLHFRNSQGQLVRIEKIIKK